MQLVPELLTNNNSFNDADSGILYNLRGKQTYEGRRVGSLSSDFSALETCQNAGCSLSVVRQQHTVVKHTKAGNLVQIHCFTDRATNSTWHREAFQILIVFLK